MKQHDTINHVRFPSCGLSAIKALLGHIFGRQPESPVRDLSPVPPPRRTADFPGPTGSAFVSGRTLRRGGWAAAALLVPCVLFAAEPPDGCLQKLLDEEEVPLSDCGDVMGRLSVSRMGVLPRGATLYFVKERPGGTGVFSSILAVAEEDGMLRRVFRVLGGDRCHGGITSAAMAADGSFVIEKNQTPLDMGTGEEDCAICCGGTKKEYYGPDGVRVRKCKSD